MKLVENQSGYSSGSASDEIEENQFISERFKTSKGGKNARMNQQMDSQYKQALKNAIFGQFQQATQKLKHLITIYPDNPDPYHLMGSMYEQAGDLQKAVEYYYINACMSSPNLEKWVKVAEMSMDLRMYDQAAYCYGRAIKIDNYNIELCLKRADAFQCGNQQRKAVTMYKRILKLSQSLLAIKKFAKLRFRRKQYSKARQILMSFTGYQHDENIIYMISETLLKQGLFQELAQFIKQHIIKNQQNLESISIQFIRMLYICCIGSPKQVSKILEISYQELQTNFYDSYEENEFAQFEQYLRQLKQLNQAQAYKLLSFLLKFQNHKTINNYLYGINYLKNKKDFKELEQFLNIALVEIPDSPQLRSQAKYLKIVLGKSSNLLPENAKKIKKEKKPKQKHEQIYYSDSENGEIQQQSQYYEDVIAEPEQKKIKEIKTKKIHKKRHIDVHDKDLKSKLLNNNSLTLKAIKENIEKDSSNQQIYFKEVKQCLELFVELTSISRVDQQSKGSMQGVISQKKAKTRRNYSRIDFEGIKNSNFLKENAQSIDETMKNLTDYLIILMQNHQYRKTVNLIQILCASDFFRKRFKAAEILEKKTTIYEIAVLSCIELEKYRRALYFMRYLISHNLNDKIYTIVIGHLAKLQSKKNFIGPMLRKYLANEAQEGQQLFYLLMAFQHIKTSQFEIAINLLAKIINSADQTYLPDIYLSLSGCFLQIASSRNTFNKMDYVNRSSYCLKQYLQRVSDPIQGQFNLARWYSQLKINDKAIQHYTSILGKQCSESLQKKSAYCLICIYKEMNAEEKIIELSEKYFTIQ